MKIPIVNLRRETNDRRFSRFGLHKKCGSVFRRSQFSSEAKKLFIALTSQVLFAGMLGVRDSPLPYQRCSRLGPIFLKSDMIV